MLRTSRVVLTELGRIVLRILLLAWLVSTLTFFLLRLAPGDPAMNIAGDTATPEQLDAVREKFGLDEPLWNQYLSYLWNAAQGDLGTSFVWQEPATDVVLRQLPYTVLLAVTAIIVLALLSLTLGGWSGWAGKKVEAGISTTVIALQSLPDFWVAVMLVLIFAVTLDWLPTGGFDGPSSLILPVATIVLYQLGTLTRVASHETAIIRRSPYVLALRGRALPRPVTARHIAGLIAIPMVTLLGVRLAGMLNGVIVVEAVFSWPGIGSTAVQALNARDYPLLQATVIIATIVVVALSSLVDLLYRVIDPRLRVEGTRA